MSIRQHKTTQGSNIIFVHKVVISLSNYDIFLGVNTNTTWRVYGTQITRITLGNGCT